MDVDKNSGIHSVCRICLDRLSVDNMYDLFLIPGLAKKLVVCTSLSVEPQDGFPKNLCGVCYTRLNDLHDFQKQCVDSVQKFQELVVANGSVFAQSSGLFNENIKEFDILDSSVHVDDEHNMPMIEEDEPISFDPLLNNKIEIIENEDEVFKMLQNVNKAAEEVVQKQESAELAGVEPVVEVKVDVDQPDDAKPIDGDKFFSSGSSSESDDPNDDDFMMETQHLSDRANDSESDDDKPLADRLRKKLEPKEKPKRKRIPAAERHLHRIIDCHICHKKFKKVSCYNKHMTYHNDKLPHQCTVETCLKGFTTANGLRLHVEHCHAETVEMHKCPEQGCDRSFARIRLLNWHLKKVHKIVKELNEPKCYPCAECEKIFRCPMALKKHMYKHDGKELPFPCNICGKRFVINSALKDHLMRHAGIKNYVCPYCGVGKTTRQEWNTHITVHTQERKFKCHLCAHASHNKQNLRMHIKIVHDKIKDYACQYCGKTFGKSNACKMHEMTHTGEKRCECKVCGKKFIHPKGLTKHLKTHEKRVLRAIEVHRKRQIETGVLSSDDPAPPMPALPIPTNNSKECHQMVAEEILKAVAESTATIPENPRSVKRVDMSELAGTAVNPIPEVAVPSWSPAINFMMKEGPYVCPDCGQGFNGPGNLKRHHRIVHEGVKDFACRFCHRRFAKAQTLKHHEMTHTGEKPHECKHCSKRFIQYVALKRHMKIHNRPPPEIPASVYLAKEELVAQENEKQNRKRKAEAERAKVAEAAKEQLTVMQQQELALKKMHEEVKEEALGNFTHINTSTMAIRTVGVNDT